MPRMHLTAAPIGQFGGNNDRQLICRARGLAGAREVMSPERAY